MGHHLQVLHDDLVLSFFTDLPVAGMPMKVPQLVPVNVTFHAIRSGSQRVARA